jgi:tRNA dimethylallyltransferase
MPSVESVDQGTVGELPDPILSREDEKISQPPLVVILGPTAVGKTGIAIQLAENLGGEIVSADSRLLYRGMDIGTAKPSLKQRSRIPHHLIDVVDPDEVWSLTLFQRAAQQAIGEIHSKGRLPFLVGGTGQYVRAILQAWQIPKVKPNPKLRTVLETWSEEIGAVGLHARLSTLDPQAAVKIDPNNLRRTIRALEVILLSGQLFSSQRARSQIIYRAIQVGLTLPRVALYERIDARIDAMLEAGLVDETRQLLEMGYAPDLPSFSAIGYHEIIDHLLGEITLDQAVMLIKRRTRQLVRRQANWFKEDDPHIHWFEADKDPVVGIDTFLRCWLETD